MAYTHAKYEVQMAPQTPGVSTAPAGLMSPTLPIYGTSLDVTGIVGEWGPGMMPHLVRGFAVVKTGDAALNTAPWAVRFQHVKGGASTATSIANVVYPTTVTSLGSVVYYIPTYNIEILPGDLVRARVTVAPSAGAYGNIMLYVEPRWELAANVTNMVLTTGAPGDA